jgi:hypothetical protein
VEVAPPGVVEEDKITSSPSDIALT